MRKIKKHAVTYSFFFHMHSIMLTISFYFRFMRSVAYRQFVRLVYAYVGASRRVPLPNCVYNSIREAFPKICCRCHILLNGPYCHACHLLPALPLALGVFVLKPPGSLASISQLLVSTNGVDGESRWGSGKLAHPCA